MEDKQMLAELIEMFKAVNDDESTDYSSINLGTRIFEDLGLNSIGIMYISLSIEERYGITVSNEAMANIKTVGDIISYIKKEKA